jgi:hypothetical protein
LGWLRVFPPVMADLVFAGLTVAVFVALGLLVKAVERL